MSNSKQSDYQTFLASLHDNFTTSDEVIRNVVKQGTGNEIQSKQKIIAGEMSEVYAITLHNNKQVILRNARQGYPAFERFTKYDLRKYK